MKTIRSCSLQSAIVLLQYLFSWSVNTKFRAQSLHWMLSLSSQNLWLLLSVMRVLYVCISMYRVHYSRSQNFIGHQPCSGWCNWSFHSFVQRKKGLLSKFHNFDGVDSKHSFGYPLSLRCTLIDKIFLTNYFFVNWIFINATEYCK